MILNHSIDQATDLTNSRLDTPATAEDHNWMGRALQLARRGLYTTHPNPRVGCVIVAGAKVLGEGWHHQAGEDHAEVVALKQAGLQAHQASMYVTLEPCCHHGRTPPCVSAIIKAGISRIVIAMRDPNPLVDHGGIAALRQAGISVTMDVGHTQAARLNRGYVSRMQRNRPWVTLKTAISLDGNTAMANGSSQWITSAAARADAHQLRAESSAILTGIGTVLRDNPSMTARIQGVERQPLRIILDSNLSTPSNARILNQPGETLIMATSGNLDRVTENTFPRSVEVMTVPQQGNRIDLNAVLVELARREVNDLMLEAGAVLSGAMLQLGLVDELVAYVAPDILGSATRGMFEIPQLSTLSDKFKFKFVEVRHIGRDLRLTLRPTE